MWAWSGQVKVIFTFWLKSSDLSVLFHGIYSIENFKNNVQPRYWLNLHWTFENLHTIKSFSLKSHWLQVKQQKSHQSKFNKSQKRIHTNSIKESRNLSIEKLEFPKNMSNKSSLNRFYVNIRFFCHLHIAVPHDLQKNPHKVNFSVWIWLDTILSSLLLVCELFPGRLLFRVRGKLRNFCFNLR